MSIVNQCHAETAERGGAYLQTTGIRADDFANLTAVPEQDERGHLQPIMSAMTWQTSVRVTHRSDADLFAYVGCVIDINLVELDAGVSVGKRLKDRANDPARATPGRPEIEDSKRVTVNLEENATVRSSDVQMAGNAERTICLNSSRVETAVTGIVVSELRAGAIWVW